MSDEYYKVTNILSGEEVDDSMEYYYACDECLHVYDWNTNTLMVALLHSEKTGHTKGRLSYRKTSDGDTLCQ